MLLMCGVMGAVAGAAFVWQAPTPTASSLSAADETPGSMAVVELFTSEGCSSCPAADALLGRIDAEARKLGRPIYCLSFHVDYWDRLGWKDRFSEESITERQRAYSQQLGLDNIYTPQMIVNGTAQFLGSDQKAAVQSLNTALSEIAPVTLDVKASGHDQQVVVHCQIKNAPPEALLCVACVDATASSTPNRGENKGRRLQHVNVVRDFQSLELTPDFRGKVTLLRADQQSGFVIAFVQEPGPGRVLGAKAVAWSLE